MKPEQLERVFRVNMRKRRLELELTQEQVAEAANMPQPHISALERGNMSPTISSIAKLAEALHCPPSALLSAETAEIMAAIP